MTVTQFRIEPDVSSFDPTASPPIVMGDEQTMAIVEEVLLGLYLRSTLTDGDRIRLEFLTPPHTSLFLRVESDHFGTLPDPDLTERATRCGLDTQTGVIFTDRHRTGNEYSARQLQTCALPWRYDSPLVVGLAEPNIYRQSEQSAARFAALVDKFRRALGPVQKAAERLEPYLSGDNPVLIVNRTSGRILVANSAFSKLNCLATTDVVGREYSEISAPLVQAALSRGLQMKNLAVAGFHLAVVQVLAKRRTMSVPALDPTSSDFLLHTMKNKLAAITAAISHLDTLMDTPHPDFAELTEIVMSEAMACDRHLEQLHLLNRADRLGRSPIYPGRAIKSAIQRAEQNFRTHIDLDTGAVDGRLSLQAPPKAIELLVESTLLTHRSRTDSDCATKVTVQSTADQLSILVRTTPGQAQNPAIDKRWQDYVNQLSQALHYSCRLETEPDHSLITTITIPLEGVNLPHV